MLETAHLGRIRRVVQQQDQRVNVGKVAHKVETSRYEIMANVAYIIHEVVTISATGVHHIHLHVLEVLW